LTRNPKYRLGCVEETTPIREHLFFDDIDWDKLDNMKLSPPFKPKVV